MAIRDWPSNERQREKLLEKGAVALSDVALLAILPRTGTRWPLSARPCARCCQAIGRRSGAPSHVGLQSPVLLANPIDTLPNVSGEQRFLVLS